MCQELPGTLGRRGEELVPCKASEQAELLSLQLFCPSRDKYVLEAGLGDRSAEHVKAFRTFNFRVDEFVALS